MFNLPNGPLSRGLSPCPGASHHHRVLISKFKQVADPAAILSTSQWFVYDIIVLVEHGYPNIEFFPMLEEPLPVEVVLEALDQIKMSQSKASPTKVQNRRPKVILFDIGGVCVCSAMA